jgi:mRNA interferase MazF
VVVKRFDVYLVGLDPTVGSEIEKARPCLVVSPDEMNQHIPTVIIAPMTSTSKRLPYPHTLHTQKKERPHRIGSDSNDR